MINRKNIIKTSLILMTMILVLPSSSSAKVVSTNNKSLVSNNNKTVIKKENQAKKFNNLKELKDFLEDNNLNNGNTYRYYARPMIEMDSMVTNGSIKKELIATNNDYSKTNIQVTGVDESDIIKTDGKYIYAVAKKNLQIIESVGDEKSKILTTIKFENQPQEIYIHNDKLIVYGYNQTIYNTKIYNNFRRRNSYTFVKVFDIKDREKPTEVRSLDFEGNYENSRLVGDQLYFFTNNWNYYYSNDFVLPKILENGKVISSEKNTARYKVPNVYYFDTIYRNTNFITLSAIDLKDDKKPVNSEVYIMPAGQNLYASENNFYITYTKYFNENELVSKVTIDLIKDKLSIKDRERLDKINAADKVVLNEDEKLQKISQIVERFMLSLSDSDQEAWQKKIKEAVKNKYQNLSKELEKTIIHKINYKDGNFSYQNEAEVYGNILNQFAMDERDGYLRIATTKNRNWSEFVNDDEKSSFANVFVLDSKLKQVAALENLAKGERIYAVRFMGERAYLVTFEQTDPLFTIDLANPYKPKVLGELKVPGFSQYLHPYDNNTLIGIGRQTVDNGNGVTTKGLKISLFDVGDVSKPREIDSYEFGGRGSDSIALNDHKAVLFSKERNLLAIPVSLTKELGKEYGEVDFSGLAVFNIDKNGIKLSTKISHNNDKKQNINNDWSGYYDGVIKRSLYIKDNLYTLSNNYLKINSLKNWQELQEITFEKVDDYKIINPK